MQGKSRPQLRPGARRRSGAGVPGAAERSLAPGRVNRAASGAASANVRPAAHSAPATAGKASVETMQLATDTTQDDVKAFLQEADEILQILDEDVVRLEREKTNPNLLQAIFRAAHTLKGSSGMLGHRRMAELAHAMESVLDKLRKGTLAVSGPVADALLHSLDILKLLRDELAAPGAAEVDTGAALAELQAVGSAQSDSAQTPAGASVQAAVALSRETQDKLRSLLATGYTAFRVKVALHKETSWAAVRCLQVLTELSGLGDVVHSVPSRQEIEQEQVGLAMDLVVASSRDEGTLRKATSSVDEVSHVDITPFVVGDAGAQGQRSSEDDAAARKTSQQAQTIRVDVERLDDLMNNIGELVIDRTRIAQICRDLESRCKEDVLVQSLRKTSAHIVKVVDSLQENTMKLRMLPIGGVFNGFPRMVRDLAQRADKKIDFIVQGQGTEIDRSVIERIRDPLVHLLRNSVDHGIEAPEERRNTGKPETGVIRLSANHEQGHIVITVEDDGRGINPAALRESVVRKGLMTAEAASRLSDTEALDLIFMPGVSTAKQATEVSGRGVGMDIVRTSVQSINGFVLVKTRVGRGTRFILKLPLTLATLQALLVSSDRTLYAVPLVYVLETVKLEAGQVHTVGGHEAIRLRGDVVPLLRLSATLRAGATVVRGADNVFAVVVRCGERRIGLAVDSLMETQEIMVKSLGRYIGDVRGVAGASILGDGRVVLILDVPSLITHRADSGVRSAAYARAGADVA